MNNKGYTFFELLLVLALLIIVSAVVTINSTWLIGENSTKAVAKQIGSHLNYIQQKAVEECRIWVMEFINTDGHDEYHIYPLGEQDNPREIVVITNKLIFWGNTSGEYLPPTTIQFSSLGAPSADSLEFAISNADGQDLYIDITPVTGKVSLSKNPSGS